jgi:hypothetical protein
MMFDLRGDIRLRLKEFIHGATLLAITTMMLIGGLTFLAGSAQADDYDTGPAPKDVTITATVVPAEPLMLGGVSQTILTNT